MATCNVFVYAFSFLPVVGHSHIINLALDKVSLKTMARKIFVSYKHSDSGVKPLRQFGITTARDYVDSLERLFGDDHIYKGERDNEDLGAFKDETIESHLRDKIFDSSVTIVLISKNMKETGTNENNQWIPWEISYSLREKTREDRTSVTNTMLAVVLPDEYGRYEYFVESLGCPHCYGTKWKAEILFSILGKNMFNRSRPKTTICVNGGCGVLHTGGDHSYIHPVKWDHFVADVNGYIDHATRINENIDDYEILKVI